MTNETEPLARLWLKWRKDALSFVRECVGVSELAEWQVTALKAISENDRVAIRSGHGVGKTMFDALVILWFGSTREDAKIPVTAPVSDQIDVNLFGELRKWHAHMRDHSAIGNWLAEQIEVKDGRVDWVNGNMCVARTARRDNPEALAGFHATNLLFLIDEASGVAEIIFETALGALSTPGAKQLMTGNPTQPQGISIMHSIRIEPTGSLYVFLRRTCQERGVTLMTLSVLTGGRVTPIAFVCSGVSRRRGRAGGSARHCGGGYWTCCGSCSCSASLGCGCWLQGGSLCLKQACWQRHASSAEVLAQLRHDAANGGNQAGI